MVPLPSNDLSQFVVIIKLGGSMAKKTAKPRKKKNKPIAEPGPMRNNPTDSGHMEKNPDTDFGGLPARDLKKNLGCG